MRVSIPAFASLSLLVSCDGALATGQKDEILLETCEDAAAGAYDEDAAPAELVAAVAALDALAGTWAVTDGCTGQTYGVEVEARAEGDVRSVHTSTACEALAVATAHLVLTHPDIGTLTFAMSGTLNAPGAWNTVDLSGLAAEDSSTRLSLHADVSGDILATLLVTDDNNDGSCQLEDWIAE